MANTREERKLSAVLKKVKESSYTKIESDEYRIIKNNPNTEQGKIFDSVIINAYYKFPTSLDGNLTLKCVTKTATVATFVGTGARTGTDSVVVYKYTATKGSTALMVRAVGTLQIADPTQAYHGATKKYVDDTIAAIPAPAAKFADGTTTADQASAGYGKTEFIEFTIPAPSVSFSHETPLLSLSGGSSGTLLTLNPSEKINSINFNIKSLSVYRLKTISSIEWHIEHYAYNDVYTIAIIKISNNVFTQSNPYNLSGGGTGLADMTVKTTSTTGTEQKFKAIKV